MSDMGLARRIDAAIIELEVRGEEVIKCPTLKGPRMRGFVNGKAEAYLESIAVLQRLRDSLDNGVMMGGKKSGS